MARASRTVEELTELEAAALTAMLHGKNAGEAAVLRNYSASCAGSYTMRLRERFGVASTYALLVLLDRRGFIGRDFTVYRTPEDLFKTLEWVDAEAENDRRARHEGSKS